jgi:hypothetical protein
MTAHDTISKVVGFLLAEVPVLAGDELIEFDETSRIKQSGNALPCVQFASRTLSLLAFFSASGFRDCVFLTKGCNFFSRHALEYTC